jgi:hypothetical protein
MNKNKGKESGGCRSSHLPEIKILCFSFSFCQKVYSHIRATNHINTCRLVGYKRRTFSFYYPLTSYIHIKDNQNHADKLLLSLATLSICCCFNPVKFVSFLLLFTKFDYFSARNVRFNFDDQFDDDSSINEQQKPMFVSKRHLPRSSFYPKILFINEQNIPYEQDRSSSFARDPKAIIKGDPREFMG